jgi:hypothetical protein
MSPFREASSGFTRGSTVAALDCLSRWQSGWWAGSGWRCSFGGSFGADTLEGVTPTGIVRSCTESSQAGRSTGSTNGRCRGAERVSRALKQGVTPTGIEMRHSDSIKPSVHAVLAGKSWKSLEELLPFNSVGSRRVPALGAESRQPDGNARAGISSGAGQPCWRRGLQLYTGPDLSRASVCQPHRPVGGSEVS